jgi:hypothetical protein
LSLTSKDKKNMPKCTIDGKEVEFKAGENLITGCQASWRRYSCFLLSSRTDCGGTVSDVLCRNRKNAKATNSLFPLWQAKEW